MLSEEQLKEIKERVSTCAPPIWGTVVTEAATNFYHHARNDIQGLLQDREELKQQIEHTRGLCVSGDDSELKQTVLTLRMLRNYFKQELAEARAVIEFYGNEENWDGDSLYCEGAHPSEKARAFLTKCPSEGE